MPTTLTPVQQQQIVHVAAAVVGRIKKAQLEGRDPAESIITDQVASYPDLPISVLADVLYQFTPEQRDAAVERCVGLGKAQTNDSELISNLRRFYTASLGHILKFANPKNAFAPAEEASHE